MIFSPLKVLGTILIVWEFVSVSRMAQHQFPGSARRITLWHGTFTLLIGSAIWT